jgi:methylase of polypeptide subunit release factors
VERYKDIVAPSTIHDLVRAALALGAGDSNGLAAAEVALIKAAEGEPAPHVVDIKDRILAGEDPLGEAFCSIRAAEDRRPLGQIYTPPPVIEAMLAWVEDEAPQPSRVVDPGVGSGRFTLAAARRWPSAMVIAADVDPLATLMARAIAAAAGVAERVHIRLMDYRELRLDSAEGRTAFVGNPPYVRHHEIRSEWKTWLAREARNLGLSASALAGLHVHFFLATARLANRDDLGAFITSAEWLDVNYGSLVRQLLVGPLGGTSVHVLEPEAVLWSDAVTTAAISCFKVGTPAKSVHLRRVKKAEDLHHLEGGKPISRARLIEARRWSPLTRTASKVPEGYVQLGELCRVHRGSVTGSNQVWVTRADETDLPAAVLKPAVTRARELFVAETVLADATALRRVIDLPVDLDELDAEVRRSVDRFLKKAKRLGVAEGYIASTRRAWWSVGFRDPAPILATYMARRPPAFVRNLADARHINIAHGLYPRVRLSEHILDRLAASLRRSITVAQGRTYAGGLTKFEPKEMERLPVPHPDLLASMA